MVTPLHRLHLCAGLVSLSVLLCQCETQRTVKSTRSTVSFDQQAWGPAGGGADNSEEIRSKFAERGYKIQEDGTIKADKPDLYSGEKSHGFDGKFETKEAKLSKKEAKTGEFKTPEYLVRQDFKGVKDARESKSSAREGETQDRQAGKLFKSKSKTTGELATYGTSDYRDGGQEFKTKTDRSTASALEDSPNASGTDRPTGYQDNLSMSMDDVKKMLSPGAYARGTGLID